MTREKQMIIIWIKRDSVFFNVNWFPHFLELYLGRQLVNWQQIEFFSIDSTIILSFILELLITLNIRLCVNCNDLVNSIFGACSDCLTFVQSWSPYLSLLVQRLWTIVISLSFGICCITLLITKSLWLRLHFNDNNNNRNRQNYRQSKEDWIQHCQEKQWTKRKQMRPEKPIKMESIHQNRHWCWYCSVKIHINKIIK